MIIVIDGPSGSGKSTMARELAKKLKLIYFDTGAMYRACCWFFLANRISPDDPEKMKEVLDRIRLEIKMEKDGTKSFWVNDTDVTKEIRSPEVTRNVSKVSAYPFIREYLVSLQRGFGKDKNAVFEGRDMGTVVFPEADVKFFLKADPVVRARRRYLELTRLYPEEVFSEERILEEIRVRDHYDSTREHSPLRQAPDAVLIDTSCVTIEEVLKEMEKVVRRITHAE